MFKIKLKKAILSLFIFFVFAFGSIPGITSLNFNGNIKFGIVSASPRSGFHSGSFSSSKSSSSSSGGFKSGSFSNSSKSSGSTSNYSGSSSNYSKNNSTSTKRSYIPIPIPIPFGHNRYYGGGFSIIGFVFKLILFIIVVSFIYKFIKRMKK